APRDGGLVERNPVRSARRFEQRATVRAVAGEARGAVPMGLIVRSVDEQRREEHVALMREVESPARFRRIQPQLGAVETLRCRGGIRDECGGQQSKEESNRL